MRHPSALVPQSLLRLHKLGLSDLAACETRPQDLKRIHAIWAGGRNAVSRTRDSPNNQDHQTDDQEYPAEAPKKPWVAEPGTVSHHRLAPPASARTSRACRPVSHLPLPPRRVNQRSFSVTDSPPPAPSAPASSSASRRTAFLPADWLPGMFPMGRGRQSVNCPATLSSWWRRAPAPGPRSEPRTDGAAGSTAAC